MTQTDLKSFPGGELVEKGLVGLAANAVTEEALLVLVAGPRLRWLGFTVPEPFAKVEPYEHTLYSLIAERESRGAHSAYNALLRRMASFTDTYAAHLRRHPEA